MEPLTLAALTSRLELADELRMGRATMLQPQDLPRRYGRVVKAIDRVLQAINCEAVVGGGWAVWRHGYLGRVTQDIDIVLPAALIAEFLRVASLSGFQTLTVPPGRWPKLMHRDTDIQVDILPEGQRPGTAARLAPTTIPHPATIGAAGPALQYITLPALIELKIAAGRTQDEADVVQLIQANSGAAPAIREHLALAHPRYVAKFEELAKRANEDAAN